MRLISRTWDSALQADVLEIIADDAEDTWNLYNLILVDDLVSGVVTRKVAKDSPETDEVALRKQPTKRIAAYVTLRTQQSFYDPKTGSLRISGTNLHENDVVPVGVQQALEVQLHQPIKLAKPDGWDSVSESTLREALSDDKDGSIVAVIMGPGVANLCLVTSARTHVKATVQSPVPSKRDTAAVQDAGTRKFFEKTLASLVRDFDFSTPRPLILASPGFYATNFKDFIQQRARSKQDDTLKHVAANVLVVHSSTIHVYGLDEVMRSQEMDNLRGGMRFTQESKHMQRFMAMLRLDDNRAWYGSGPVTKAVADGAVGSGKGLLLMNSSLFRSNDLATRKRYVTMVDTVKSNGGEVRILSSEHESGKQLELLGNVAAILNYPMIDLDQDEGGEEEAEQATAAGLAPHTERDQARQDREEIDPTVNDFLTM